MSLPSMTTAFCLSGIAGLALTSAAMPPIGDGVSDSHPRCEAAAHGAPCVPTHAVTEKLGYPLGAVPATSDLRAHCRKLAVKAKEQALMQLAANCTGANTASAASRLD